MRRRLAALALTFAAAQAPPDSVGWQRFWPDAVGNEWQYEHRWERCMGLGGCTQGAYVRVHEVIADTLIEGVGFAVISTASESGAEVGRCAVGFLPGASWFAVRDVPGYSSQECPVWEAPSGPGNWNLTVDMPYAPDTVVVSTIPYVVDAIRHHGHSAPPSQWNLVYFAADLGLIQASQGWWAGSHSSTSRATLTYARVGGVTYGVPLVAAGPTPRGAPALAVSVRPNPAHAAVSLTLTLPASGGVLLEVLDLLGRVVLTRDLGTQAAGVSAHALDTSALAPGVYVLRAVTPDGVATRRFARAD